jgi:hypothetical protein
LVPVVLEVNPFGVGSMMQVVFYCHIGIGCDVVRIEIGRYAAGYVDAGVSTAAIVPFWCGGWLLACLGDEQSILALFC